MMASHYVAIDFGTSGSCVAFATKDLSNIHVLSDWSKNVRHTGASVKVPTIVLLDPTQNLEAVGEDALYFYQKKAVKKKGEFDQYYLFNRFKMSLYSETPEQDMTRSFNVKAENGRELPVVIVIAKLLEYFKIEFLGGYSEFAKKQPKLPPISQIMWILTVPAIWSLAAKQIMKDAAKMAGLLYETNKGPSNSIMFALEPEAAAIYCQKEFALIEKAHNVKNDSCNYLIVDCGGGTVDIAAHKLTQHENGDLKIEELVHVHGGPLGGFAVNDQFEKMFVNICKFSDDDKMELKKIHTRDWTILMNEFEKCKMSNEKVNRTINVPGKIIEFIEQRRSKKMKKLVDDYKNHNIEYDEEDKELVLPYATLRTFFSVVIAGIREKIMETLKNISEQIIEKIILVGGFANCDVLFKKVKEDFSNTDIEVIIGPDPWLSILKGAVIFAKEKNIYSRIMPYTVGVQVNEYFDEAIHDKKYKEVTEGVEYCKKVLYPLVKANQSVQGGNIVTYEFRPISDSQSFCEIIFYATRKENVKYTDDDSCFELGKCTIENLPKERSGESREVCLTTDFSNTDGIKVLAFSVNTKEELKLSLDFTKYAETLYLPVASV